MKTHYNEVVVADNLPYDTNNDTLYYSPRYSLVKFLCPCGCKHEIVLRTAEEVDVPGRKWKVQVVDNKMSLWNSIWVNWEGGCQSHFFIKDNKVIWVSDYKQEEIYAKD